MLKPGPDFAAQNLDCKIAGRSLNTMQRGLGFLGFLGVLFRVLGSLGFLGFRV